MARELKSFRERRETRKKKTGGKKGTPFMVVLILILLAVGLVGYYFYEKKFAPTKVLADKAEYFGVSGDEVALFLNDEQLFTEEDKPVTGRVINGGLFLPYEWVMSELNRGFYWAKDVNEILYTLPKTTERYGLGDTLEDGSTAFVRIGDTTEDLFLNIKFVQKYTDIRYSTHLEDESKRAFIFNDWSPYETCKVKGKESVRLLGEIKSEVLTTLKSGDNVKLLEAMENWSKVQTGDGYIGWLRNKHLSDKTEVTPESGFKAPDYTHITRIDGSKVVLGFHQITSSAANAYIDDMVKGVTGMNVIAPTWFILTSDEGDFNNYWTQEYVDNAHARGYQVWATVNNFDGGDIDESVFLKSTEIRAKLISNLVNAAVAGGIDGLNIDFELIPERLGRDYVQFMRELAVECRKAGIILSADCYVPYGYNSYYDLEELGKHIDYVIIMCYDEHYAGSEEGSVSSIGYLNHGISETTKMVPADRVIIAVPFYTRVWMTNAAGETSSDALGMSDSLDWVQNHGVELSWIGDDIGQNYGEVVEDGITKKVWLEDQQSMQLKIDAIKEAGCGGVGAWKLGQEPSDIWEIVNINQ